MFRSLTILVVVAVMVCTEGAYADPCGMVPPITVKINPSQSIQRIGDQMTFVFFKDGIEDIIINPSFKGKISEFGMLVPFPSAPAIRSVPDDIFQQVMNAVEPPKCTVQVPLWRRFSKSMSNAESADKDPKNDLASGALAYNTVRVLKEEAVGMYQAATLEAGSPKALEDWMAKNGYMYPKGMEEAVKHFVTERWCFVAIKARVGTKKDAQPKAGMKEVDNKLPEEAEFTGAVHATGFRFKTDKCVVPMRMATYNEGRLFNRLYCLSDSPVYIEQLPKEMVKKQLNGKKLIANMTDLLPLELVGGTAADMESMYGKNWENMYAGQRDPSVHNAKAKDAFLSDVLAVQNGSLIHPFEESEKKLFLVAERMGLRGHQIHEFIQKSLAEERKKALDGALKGLEKMTLTVVEGDFPRDVLRNNELTFGKYEMPVKKGGIFEISEMMIALLIVSAVSVCTLRRKIAVKK